MWRSQILRRSFRRAVAKLGLQTAQAVDVVNVVPRWQHVNVETDLAGAGQGLFRDPLGAPGYVFEHATVREFKTQEVIAAVG